MTIARIRITMAGAGVSGPGLMTFYSRNLTPSLPASALTLLNALAPSLAGSVTFTVPNSGDTIDETTGALVGAWSGSGGGSVTTPGGVAFTLGSGALIQWKTGQVWGGHRVQGHTFLVPINNANFDSNGRIGSDHVAGWTTMCQTFITDNGGDLVVWVRPRKAGTGKNHDLPARPGTLIPITTAAVSSTPTALRSRRT